MTPIRRSNLGRSSMLLALLVVLVGLCDGCRRAPAVSLVSRAQTFAELRSIKRGVSVTPPDEASRPPYARERLVDGEAIKVDPGGLCWLRRDGGATLLLSGPASLVLRANALELGLGKVFVDTLSSASADIRTPRGLLHLARVRASIEIAADGAVSAYVLQGAVRTDSGAQAVPGELLTLSPDGKVKKAAAVAWEDWTGGLATTDPTSQPAPFGIGTVGARKPGDQGSARFALAIQRLEVKVKVDGDYAETEVDEIFFNPTSETLEGIYSFRTPEGATLHKFGVDRDGSLVWGYVKEKQAAAAQYQEHVYEGSQEDPALLEWNAPGVYKARIHPIKPRATRRVVTRYGEWLARQGAHGERRLYVYPMAAEGAEASLPRIEELTVSIDLVRANAREVRVGMQGKRKGDRVVVTGRDFVPRADLAVELFDSGADLLGYRSPHTIDRDSLPPADVVRAEKNAKTEADYLLLLVRPTRANEPPGGIDVAIVVDSSAATEPSALAIARATAGAILAHLGPDDRAAVWAADATLRPVVDGSDKFAAIDGARRQAIATGLAQIDRGGATDLGTVLADAAARLDPSRRGAVVYIGDGQPTVGEFVVPELRGRLERLPRPVRLFTIGVGDRANMAILSGIARGAFAARVTDAYGAAGAALRVLEAAERSVWLGASVDLGPGIDRVLPRELGALAADESAVVVGRVVGALPKRVVVRGSGGEISSALVVRALQDDGDLRRRWAEGRLVQLLDEGAGRAVVVELGVRSGIITPFTSLYVPTADEHRKDLDRIASSDTSDDSSTKHWWQWPWFSTRSRYYAETEQVAETNADNKEGGTGTRAKGEEGSMGNPVSAKASGRRYAVQGPSDNADPHIQRQAALRESAEFGMIGVLNAGSDKAPSPAAERASTSSGARERLSDQLEMAQMGKLGAPATVGVLRGGEVPTAALDAAAMSGDGVSASGGSGLNLGGGGVVRPGGGGQGIGLGSIGSTTGHGAGTGTGQGFGPGSAAMVKGPSGNASVAGVEVKGGAVSNADRVAAGMRAGFRACFNRGLASNPDIQGWVRIVTKIGPNGEVLSATPQGGGGLGADVMDCVVRRVKSASFAPPEGGGATITIPVTFANQGGGSQPSAAEIAKAEKAAAEQAAREAAEASKQAADRVKQAANEAADKAEAVRRVLLNLAAIGHAPAPCPPSADLPFEERYILWRERLARANRKVDSVVTVYNQALRACEAPTWRERTQLLLLAVDALGSIGDRVELWRALQQRSQAADVVYRAILTRVHTAAEIRELHDALGLRHIDPGVFAKALDGAKSTSDRLDLLRGLLAQWPDDVEIALKLLETYEDVGDDAGGRALARRLRRRADATTRLRTAVGEYYLRLGTKAKGPAAERETTEARRTFGEIVEFAPEDPAARRRLGDLLRAHGWYEEAFRQYESLARLVPDDTSVPLLLSAAAQGMGRTEEAIGWTEKATAAGVPDGTSALAKTARALASAFLAWARDDAVRGGRKDEAERLRERARRLGGVDAAGAKAVRIILTWSHPELHPELWSNALGAPMPVADGDPLIGVAQAVLPSAPGEGFIELRLAHDDAERAARIGAEAALTAIVDEGGDGERIVRLPVSFARASGKLQERRRFKIGSGTLEEEAL